MNHPKSVLVLMGCVLGFSSPVLRAQGKRTVTVADAICMTKLATPFDEPTLFSRDGQKFVIVLKKANLERNTNEYSLLLWNTNQIFSKPTPEILVSLSSSSNRPAIKDVTWLEDNKTLFFLGENPGELQEVYSLDVSTHALKKLTNSQSNVVSYTTSAHGDNILYAAEPTELNVFDAKAERDGLVLSNQLIDDIVVGHRNVSNAVFRGDVEFFLQLPGKPPTKPREHILSSVRFDPQVMSPDGEYVVILAIVDAVPASWADYLDPNLRWWARHERTPLATGQRAFLLQTMVLNTSTGEIRPLLDAPTSTSSRTEISWSPDSRAVVITNTFLPISGIDEKDRSARLGTAFSAVEVKLPDLRSKIVSREDLNSPTWLDANHLSFRAGKSKWERTAARVIFEETGGAWTRAREEPVEQGRVSIVQEEGLNQPPRIFATEAKTGRRAMLLDPNPQFANLLLAKEEAIEWKGSDGHRVTGGLYYPIGYEPGRRYPLVIQTHLFRADKFWIDGPFPTAFAAQPLAARGVMVLQMAEDYSDSDTPKEVDREMASLEGAIDDLHQRGLIDRGRIGVIGFSRTCLHVKFALTHSRYHFAAASVADGGDNGYFQYILKSGINLFEESFEGSNGGLPFGEGLKSWMQRSPGFKADKVSTPLFIEAPNPHTALSEWEWYAALKRLGKPVEMVVLADGVHELQKPWDRRVSLQTNVDWFCFWLKDEEDPDPAKTAQYSRWRQLRKLQEQHKESVVP